MYRISQQQYSCPAWIERKTCARASVLSFCVRVFWVELRGWFGAGKLQKVVKMSGSTSLFSVLGKFYDEYSQKTTQKTKLIDAYLMYIMFTGIIQFVYCLLVGTFPFNSFLSGFISCVGSFVLAGKDIF